MWLLYILGLKLRTAWQNYLKTLPSSMDRYPFLLDIIKTKENENIRTDVYYKKKHGLYAIIPIQKGK